MNELFKNLLNKSSCAQNGICSTDPVLNALEAVFINEIRQIAFYIVRLKEFNLTNFDIMKEAAEYLSISVIDTSFDKDALFNFYKRINKTKKDIKEFYLKKLTELNISYEFMTPVFAEDNQEGGITSLIKTGENLIRKFYNVLKKEKSRLVSLITVLCKISAVNLVKLSNYKEPCEYYYFEILRLLSLTNYISAREEKLIRRIKEFSDISYKIQADLDKTLCGFYGQKQGGKISTNIYKGKSVFILGGDFDELYRVLEAAKSENINVYVNPSFIQAFSYPKFKEFKNFKGIFGINNTEYDFSKFMGPIYITRNSAKALDGAIRGKIFTSKLIPTDRSIKIDPKNPGRIIEEAKLLEGFREDIKGFDTDFEFDLDKIKNIKENKVLITIGENPLEGDKKFSEHKIINFVFQNETYGLYHAIEELKEKEISVYFSDCSLYTVGVIMSLLNKNLSGIYFSECSVQNINPHITESLRTDFNIKII